jgi:uncharacterized tellurite resistance protein B-like protein
MAKDYHLGLLCLTHLLICADGIEHANEIDALRILKNKEGISDGVFSEFQEFLRSKSEKEVYHCGLDHLSRCSQDEKLKVFVTLYKLSEVDGRVHVKEIKLLLYSIKNAGVEFNDVVNRAMDTPSLI